MKSRRFLQSMGCNRKPFVVHYQPTSRIQHIWPSTPHDKILLMDHPMGTRQKKFDVGLRAYHERLFT